MPERRSKPRFAFQQPVLIRLESESDQFQGITENASTVGVFLTTYSAVPLNSEVDLTIAMPYDVRVSCQGKVVRVEPGAEEGKIGIAVQCTVPFAEELLNRGKLNQLQSVGPGRKGKIILRTPKVSSSRRPPC